MYLALVEIFIEASLCSITGAIIGLFYAIRKTTATAQPSGVRKLSIVLVAGAGGAVLFIIFEVVRELLFTGPHLPNPATIALPIGFGIAYLLTQHFLKKHDVPEVQLR